MEDETLTVYLPVWAEYAIRVKVTDEMRDAEGEVDYDLVIDEAYNVLPSSSLCYGCSTGNSGASWSDRSPISLELGDDPEVRYIMDDKGKTVYGDPTAKLGW